MKKNKKVLTAVLSVCFLLSVYFGYLGFKTFNFLGKIKGEKITSLDQQDKDGRINVIIAGIDTGEFIGGKVRGGAGRTDTLMVASIDTIGKKIQVLSIPRDSRVNIPGKGMDKVNHAHAFGGMDLTVRTVQGLLEIPIHHYVRVNFEAFVAMVDAVGGVTLEIKPSDLQGVINQDKNIRLEPGVQLLDSEHAFQYVRIRNGDIGRIERQQKFIKALLKETLSMDNILKSPVIFDSVAEHLETDMSAREMLSLATKVRGFNSDSIQTETLPGKGAYIKGVSYWEVNDAKKDEIIQTKFR